jgi:hypothetical protein
LAGTINRSGSGSGSDVFGDVTFTLVAGSNAAVHAGTTSVEMRFRDFDLNGASDTPNNVNVEGGNLVMYLWGATKGTCIDGEFSCASWGDGVYHRLGADLKLILTAVPLPAALPLLMAGIAGLGFVGRKRRREAV